MLCRGLQKFQGPTRWGAPVTGHLGQALFQSLLSTGPLHVTRGSFVCSELTAVLAPVYSRLTCCCKNIIALKLLLIWYSLNFEENQTGNCRGGLIVTYARNTMQNSNQPPHSQSPNSKIGELIPI